MFEELTIKRWQETMRGWGVQGEGQRQRDRHGGEGEREREWI